MIAAESPQIFQNRRILQLCLNICINLDQNNGKYYVKKSLFISPSRFLESYFFPVFYVTIYRFMTLSKIFVQLLLINIAILCIIFGQKGLFKANLTTLLLFFIASSLFLPCFLFFFRIFPCLFPGGVGGNISINININGDRIFSVANQATAVDFLTLFSKFCFQAIHRYIEI